MYNWSTNVTKLKKNKSAHAIWQLEQLVNFGLGKDKISRSALKKNWSSLRLDPVKKKYLELILWP